MVSQVGTTAASGRVVRHQWVGDHSSCRIILRSCSYSFGQACTLADVNSFLLIPSHCSSKLTQIASIFLFVGLITIASAPIAYWRLDNDIASARFLTPNQRIQAVERLRANQSSASSSDFKWAHVKEVLLEPKTWFWIGMALLTNLGAQVANTFGPFILQGLGFNKYTTSLLNMPFGALQFLVIIAASYAAQKAKWKSAVLATLMLPVITGLVMLYVLPRTAAKEAPLLVGYYLLAFLFGGVPLIVSWIVGNTGGATKKSVMMSLYQAGASAGNIIGPLLFTVADKPGYHPGLRKVLAVFCTLLVVIALQLANLMWLNRRQQVRRVQNGKPTILHDHSMEERYVDINAGNLGENGARLGQKAFADLTDRENDEFVYLY